MCGFKNQSAESFESAEARALAEHRFTIDSHRTLIEGTYRVPFECLRFRFGGEGPCLAGARESRRVVPPPPPPPGLTFSLFNLSPCS